MKANILYKLLNGNDQTPDHRWLLQYFLDFYLIHSSSFWFDLQNLAQKVFELDTVLYNASLGRQLVPHQISPTPPRQLFFILTHHFKILYEL